MNLSRIAIALLLSAVPFFAQTAGQDMKQAGQDVKDATKQTGKATRRAARTTGRKVKQTTHRAAAKVEQKTRDKQ
jgi:hypothetical protein